MGSVNHPVRGDPAARIVTQDDVIPVTAGREQAQMVAGMHAAQDARVAVRAAPHHGRTSVVTSSVRPAVVRPPRAACTCAWRVPDSW